MSINLVPGGSSGYFGLTGMEVPTFPNTFKISIFNKICIAVIGQSNSLSNFSEYSLIVAGRNTHSILKEYSVEQFFLGPLDEKYFMYGPQGVPKEALGVELHIMVTVGDVSVFLSSENKYPNDKSNE